MNKAQKFTIAVFAVVAVILYFSWQSQAFTIDVNGLLNGTLQSLVAGIILVPVAIVVNRYMYHRRSKN